MRRLFTAACAVLALALAAPAAAAQQTTGNITGRIIDAQGAAVPGVTVTAKNTATGFTRTEVSDAEGIYRLTALPVGTYDLTAELQGFARFESKGVVVNVGQTLDVDIADEGRGVQESVNVTGGSPLIETTSSSVGGVVDIERIESLPLNGRQFANLAATIPGVGLGFHSDPTKSTQFSPQIGGGNGRNVNYQIDGGDNNDDTVGGLLQLFPLEAIQEFNFVTSRYKAEYGRSNGGVMNIVTKSGTNDCAAAGSRCSATTAMNAKTETEKRHRRPTSRTTAATSTAARSAARSCRTRRTSSAPSSGRSRTRSRSCRHAGLFPDLDGVVRDAVPREPVHRKVTANLTANAVPRRCATAATPTRSPTARALTRRRTAGARARTTFNSINVNHNWVLGGCKLNEFIFQYADFANASSAQQPATRTQTFPNGVASARTPTRRRRRSRRSISSATTSRGTRRAWAASATTSRPA